MTEELLRAIPMDISVHKTLTLDSNEYRQSVFDVMSIKVNGIKIAFETANTLLRTSHFVKELLDNCEHKDEAIL